MGTQITARGPISVKDDDREREKNMGAWQQRCSPVSTERHRGDVAVDAEPERGRDVRAPNGVARRRGTVVRRRWRGGSPRVLARHHAVVALASWAPAAASLVGAEEGRTR